MKIYTFALIAGEELTLHHIVIYNKFPASKCITSVIISAELGEIP